MSNVRRPCEAVFWLLVVALFFAILPACGSESPGKYGFKLDTPVDSAVFTPDSKYIIAGGHDRMFLLDIAEHKLIDRFPRDADAGTLGVPSFEVIAISPDGKYVASAGAWKPVRVWDFQTGKLVRAFDMNRTAVQSLAFSPDSKWLAAGTAYRLHDGPDLLYEAVYDIWLWDIAKEGDKPVTFRGHEAPVQAIVFLPDGKRIVSVSSVWILRLWDVATQRELKRSGTWMAPARLGPITSGLTFDAHDSRAGWLLANGRKQLPLTISADGKYVVCGRSVWSTDSLQLEYFADGRHLWKDFDQWQRVNLTQPVRVEDKQAKIIAWFAYSYVGALTPDNRRLVVAGLFGLHGTFSGHGNLRPKGEELLAMKTPNGQQLYTGHESQLAVFDVETGNLLFEDQVFCNGASVFALDVSPDGRYALAAGSGHTAGPGGAFVRSDPCQLYLYRLPQSPATSDASQLGQPSNGE